jgi:hypothetical protein
MVKPGAHHPAENNPNQRVLKNSFVLSPPHPPAFGNNGGDHYSRGQQKTVDV